jgi:hypothetical protein
MSVRIEWSRDVGAGAWIAPRLHPFATDVGSLLPACFEAYVRLLHPAWRDRPERRKVRWRELAAGAALAPATHYDDLRPDARFEPPLVGSLERDELQALIDVLSATGDARALTWFAVWDGFGWITGHPAHAALAPDAQPAPPAATPDIPRLRLPQRDYLLYRGPLQAATALYRPPADRSPNLWWPEDRRWCVASEIDLPVTYVGGPASLAEALLRDTRLEALAVTAGDPVGPPA